MSNIIRHQAQANRNSVSSRKAFTITCELISRMACWNPRSDANWIAVVAAIASTSRRLYAWGICLDSEPNIMSSLSRMTTLIPALFFLVNLAPSQLIFTILCAGGFHFCVEGEAVRKEGGGGFTTLNSWSRSFANGVIECRLQLSLFSQTWFRCVMIDHTITEKSSRCSWFWSTMIAAPWRLWSWLYFDNSTRSSPPRLRPTHHTTTTHGG